LAYLPRDCVIEYISWNVIDTFAYNGVNATHVIKINTHYEK